MSVMETLSDGKYTKSTYIIYVKKLNDNAILPTKAHRDDAGWDLYSVEDVLLKPHETKLVKIGIAVELPDNYFAKIFDRSGNALKLGIHVLAGVIDNGYRGEIGVVLHNLTDKDINIPQGSKIAQMVLLKSYYSEVKEVSELHETERNDKGFGSSGL